MTNHVLEKLLEALKENLDHLQEKKNLTLNQYLNDWQERAIVERKLQLAIQTAIDIGTRLISHKKLTVPQNAKAIFKILLENKLIAEELAEKLEDLVALRNELVHEYREIENDTVYSYLQKAPPILKAFGEAIVNIAEQR